MKKVIILVASFMATATANAQSFVTAQQLKEYKNSLSYMGCVYSGNEKCYGAESLQQARATATKIKAMPANGINAGRKRSLDATAGEILLFISVDEAEAFLKGLSNKSTLEILDEYTDSAKSTVTISMPGEKTLEYAEKGIYNAQGMNSDAVKQVIVKDKKEMLAMAETQASATSEYSSRPEYLKGVKYVTQVDDKTTYQVLEGGKLVVCKNIMTEEANALGMETEKTSEQYLRRYPEENYEIKIIESNLTIDQKIKAGVYSADKKPVIDVDLTEDITKPVSETVDQQWEHRYDDMKKADAKQRRFDSNYLMLEYAVNKIEKYNAKLENAKTERQKAFYTKKQAKFYKNAKIYYNNLQEFANEEKVQALQARYNALAGSM